MGRMLDCPLRVGQQGCFRLPSVGQFLEVLAVDRLDFYLIGILVVA